MYTINRLASILLMTILVMNAFVAEIIPSSSSYSFNLDILDCDNLEYLKGCRHEIGHKMDDDMGMPSQSKEFAIATQAIVQTMWITLEPDEFGMFIQLYPDSNPIELYAGLYSYVEGDISKLPESLQPFFSTDASYLDLYDCLAQSGLNVCGRSVSYLKGETQ